MTIVRSEHLGKLKRKQTFDDQKIDRNSKKFRLNQRKHLLKMQLPVNNSTSFRSNFFPVSHKSGNILHEVDAEMPQFRAKYQRSGAFYSNKKILKISLLEIFFYIWPHCKYVIVVLGLLTP